MYKWIGEHGLGHDKVYVAGDILPADLLKILGDDRIGELKKSGQIEECDGEPDSDKPRRGRKPKTPEIGNEIPDDDNPEGSSDGGTE